MKVLQYFTRGFLVEEEDANGPQGLKKKKMQKVGSFFKNIFSRRPKLSTKSFMSFDKGQIEEVEFATSVWENN